MSFQWLEPVIKPLLEILIESAIRNRGLVLDRVRQATAQVKSSFFLQRPTLINRERELRTIRSALHEKVNSRFILLIGPGGAGKTRILQEAERALKTRRGSMPLKWSGIIDMYHPELRSVLELHSLLIDKLDPKRQAFQSYRQLKTRFEERRRNGISSHSLEQERNELNQVFQEDFAQFSSLYRPVLVFDTVENLTTESDLLQTLCQIRNPQSAVRDWLINEAGSLPNTVLLLAGRPQATLHAEIRQRSMARAGQVEVLDVTGLTRADSCQLLQHLVNEAGTGVEGLMAYTDELWELTRGLPVQLALIVELICKIDVESLQTVELDENVQAWVEKLVARLFDYAADEPLPRLFYLLAIARRGMTADLLHYLEPSWSLEECHEYLTSISTLSVVKTRPGTEELFLHDALYELFDEYNPPSVKRQPLYQRLADYYQMQQANAGSDRKEWGRATVNRLHYELQNDPKKGFEAGYLRWDDVAIRGREAELEVQLRNELLRFFDQNQARAAQSGLTENIREQESAIRWVKYFVDTSNYKEAIKLAETIFAFIPVLQPIINDQEMMGPRQFDLSALQQTKMKQFFNTVSPFFCGQLLTYYGDALTFTTNNEAHTAKILQAAIDWLRKSSFDEDQPLFWLQQRVLGRTYNALGYLAHSFGHYGSAHGYFRQALTCYSTLGVEDERGNTLNNLAYLLAILGDSETAKRFVNDALEIRRQLGQTYPIGLSYNTRGLIHALSGDFEWGENECQRALELFHEIESVRGIGLAYNALGYIGRMKADVQATQNQNRSKEWFNTQYEQACYYLTQAIDIFSSEINEPIRLWEAYNELGCLYHDWGRWALLWGDEAVATTYQERAIAYHRQACDVAQQKQLFFQLADTYDDLAESYAALNDWAEAENWLAQSLAMVPAQYHLKPFTGTNGLVSNNSVNRLGHGESFWLILGKAYFQKGLWFFRVSQQNDLTLDDCLQYCCMAILCFQRFWRTSHALKPRLQTIVRQVKLSGANLALVKEKIAQIALQNQVDLSVLSNAFDGKFDETLHPL